MYAIELQFDVDIKVLAVNDPVSPVNEVSADVPPDPTTTKTSSPKAMLLQLALLGKVDDVHVVPLVETAALVVPVATAKNLLLP